MTGPSTSSSFLLTDESKPKSLIDALPSDISPSKYDIFPLLFFIGDSEVMRLMTPVTFAFAVGLQISARVSKSLGLDYFVILLLIMKCCGTLNWSW